MTHKFTSPVEGGGEPTKPPKSGSPERIDVLEGMDEMTSHSSYVGGSQTPAELTPVSFTVSHTSCEQKLSKASGARNEETYSDLRLTTCRPNEDQGNELPEIGVASAKPKTEDQIRKLASEIGLRPQIAYIPSGDFENVSVTEADIRRKKDKTNKTIIREEKTSEGFCQFNRWVPVAHSDVLSNLVLRLKSTNDWKKTLLTDPVNEIFLRQLQELEVSKSLLLSDVDRINAESDNAIKKILVRDEEIKRLIAKKEAASIHATQISIALRILIGSLAKSQAHLIEQQAALSRCETKIRELGKALYGSELARLKTEALYRETLTRSAAQQKELIEMRPLYGQVKNALTRIEELEWAELQWEHIAATRGWRLALLRLTGIYILKKPNG